MIVFEIEKKNTLILLETLNSTFVLLQAGESKGWTGLVLEVLSSSEKSHNIEMFHWYVVSFSHNNCLSFRFQCFPFVFTITEGCFIAFYQAGCYGDQQLLYAVKITLLP